MNVYGALVAVLGFIALLGGVIGYIAQAQKSLRKRRHAASPLLAVDEQQIKRDEDRFAIEYVLRNKGPDAIRDIKAGTVGEDDGVIGGGAQVLGAGEEIQIRVRVQKMSACVPWVFATDASGQRWELRFDVLFGERNARPVRGKFGSWGR
jgi:hypothetical protein